MHRDREDEQLFALLEAVDEPVPDVDVDDIIARAATPVAPRVGRWAAAILLTFGAAGAAYAAPGSPLPGWIDALAGGTPASSVVTDDGAPDVSGIVVAATEPLTIELQPQESGDVRFLFVDEASVTVEASAGAAVFDSRPRRLVVQSVGAPDFRISMPLGAEVDVLIDGRSVFHLAAGEITTAAALGASGQYSLSFRDIR